MAHTQISLIQKIYDLYKDVYQAVKLFPKGDKHNLGNEIKNYSLQLLELLFKAERAKKDWKLPHLENADTKLSLLKLLFRLAYDLKIIDQRKSINLQEQLQEIGRMLGGWIKSVK
ncbi:diversity-generating retroelement protein Avd [Candidatus Kuenenbacteria bacterium]|nr:diversity-generating retroelement protein Avd [Candidatus Kuenenbacteria bacterium]